MVQQDRVIELLSEHYGEFLDRRNIEIGFPGGFLNFGDWTGIPLKSRLTLEQRVDSQRAMYRSVLKLLGVKPSDVVLEIASGRGSGCVLALEEYNPAKIFGIDVMPIQVERAKKFNSDALDTYPNRLNYQVGSGMNIPYADNYFDKVFSVEAFLYFSDLNRCLSEICRVMRRPARLSVACVFATSSAVPSDDWLHLFDRSGVATGFAISDIISKLNDFGFTDVSSESIGRNVWFGYREWVAQNFDIEHPMPERWYQGYRAGLFDYYILSATLSS